MTFLFNAWFFWFISNLITAILSSIFARFYFEKRFKNDNQKFTPINMTCGEFENNVIKYVKKRIDEKILESTNYPIISYLQGIGAQYSDFEIKIATDYIKSIGFTNFHIEEIKYNDVIQKLLIIKSPNI